jgi:hypothetical protein
MDMKDVTIDTYTNSSPLVRMRLTHKSTGKSVNGEDASMLKLKKRLIKELESKIAKNA